MTVDPKFLFLGRSGKISRSQFWIGFVGVFLFIAIGNYGLSRISGTMTAFYIALFFPFIALYMIYCVYGKRLLDMGRKRSWVFGIIALEIVAIIAVMLGFGGAEYFSEFSQFDRKEAIDPEITQAIIDKYQARQEDSLPIIKAMLLVIPTLFTIWVGSSKGQTDT